MSPPWTSVARTVETRLEVLMDADNAALDIPVVVVLEPSGRQATVRLHGEVDVEVEPCIVEAVHRTARLEGLAAIDVDATGVTFIDSSGLRALVLGREEARSRGLQYTVQITAGSFVARVFAITGLDEALGITQSVALAGTPGAADYLAHPAPRP
jgi:anti-anti-sigma factor